MQGERVTLYGNSEGLGIRTSQGIVIQAGFAMCRDRPADPSDHHPQVALCAAHGMGAVDYGMLVDADAGPGFSGGGIYGDDGALLGIVTDRVSGGGIFAYWASDAKAEVARQ